MDLRSKIAVARMHGDTAARDAMHGTLKEETIRNIIDYWQEILNDVKEASKI